MPEYFCEACNFKTPIKCKFITHNETSKHLKKMESFVKVEVSENPLQAKVDMLEQTIKLLIKRIEVLENKQDVIPVVEQVNEPVIDDKIDIDDLIAHVEQQTFINLDEYTSQVNDVELIDWESYINKNLDDNTQQKILNGKVIWDMLKDTYETNSEKAIFKKIVSILPKNIIKVNDISRGKFSIYCNGEWLNSVESTEKIETLINNLQQYISNLHHIYNTCRDINNKNTDDDTYLKLLEKVFQGKEVKSRIVKLILSSY